MKVKNPPKKEKLNLTFSDLFRNHPEFFNTPLEKSLPARVCSQSQKWKQKTQIPEMTSYASQDSSYTSSTFNKTSTPHKKGKYIPESQSTR